jgi:aminotransferase in exopolysaccharide biosynthesis
VVNVGRKFIPLSVPNLKGNELKYVTHAVKTEWVSSGGAYVDEFEKKIADYVNSIGAVSCQNGTAGIHVALRISGTEAENEVIVPSLTFIAAVNPVKYIGADPIFMDCDDSLTLDPIKLETFCKDECDFIDGKLINRKTKKHITSIIVVHVFGNMADMVKIMAVARNYNLKVIEDATEALGTYYTDGPFKDKYAGTMGDIGVYSFNGNKIMTTGGGGMIVSNNQEYLQRAKHLTTQAKSNEVYYTHDEIGYNYRMTNLQAGLGIAQLEQLETFIENKKENYFKYKKAFENHKDLEVISFREDIRPNYWFYSLFVSSTFNKTRNELIDYLQSQAIQTRPIWGLIHEQKPYLDSQTYKIEIASEYLGHVVNLPCSSNLTSEDVEYVIRTIMNS